MRLEDQVCSLELARELKELGVKQNSLWYWLKNPCKEHIKKGGDKYFVSYKAVHGENHIIASAFTVAELGELLPDKIQDIRFHGVLYIKKENYYWIVGYRKNLDQKIYWEQVEDTEANARAKMLIYLIKEGLIKN